MMNVEEFIEVIGNQGEKVVAGMVYRVKELEAINENLEKILRQSCIPCSKLGGCQIAEQRRKRLVEGEREIKFWEGLIELCETYKKEKR